MLSLSSSNNKPFVQQRKSVRDTFNSTNGHSNGCCNDHHCSGSSNTSSSNNNGNVGNGLENMGSKYFKPRRRRNEERKRKTLSLFLLSMIVLWWTWRTTVSRNQQQQQQRGRRQQQPGLFQYSKRDAAKREERKRRAQARDDANRLHNQQQQQQQQIYMEGRPVPLSQNHQDDDVDHKEDAHGFARGIFNAFFHSSPISKARTRLKEELYDLDRRIRDNENRGIRWINMQLIPPLHSDSSSVVKFNSNNNHNIQNIRPHGNGRNIRDFFKAKRQHLDMAWEMHDKATQKFQRDDFVDYTKHDYEYPKKLMEPPSKLGDYPRLMPLSQIMEIWPQDELDHPPNVIEENLIHFDFENEQDMEAAVKFRDAKLPFKVINVPEVTAAGRKWTDEYVSNHFDASSSYQGIPKTEGTAQESPDNYFAWHHAQIWDIDTMGVPPTRNNDFSYEKWARHARYADRIGLSPHQPHFYWQSGVDREERYKDTEHWTFVSRDLPSFSSVDSNFFLFEPEAQKGIQCRFGERGVTAATHFDGGRNMVAMMTGAKRYILSPPKECGKLGIVTARGNPIFRHSLLNFGHLNHMDNQTMPQDEREWLELAGTAQAVSTVLKAGEVLYIPSHWFHYITSLQKSAQCNVRSGIDREGDAYFGGYDDVTYRCSPGEGM
ncbi:cupin-like domain containing protein [Nitzschia inconspicua]|uniref:Cupin-like domain containing protein n=1 Tax=Nitzschia inconspicua TaxID=303405 RepID=A0A9K3KG58_9STRA|nr:cupin-like domain containing protein [Nitzschia inconspicua]